MKVLWFEISTPSRYKDDGRVVCGWQDALENIVKDCREIELYIAFETEEPDAKVKVIDGVTYIPMVTLYSFHLGRPFTFKSNIKFNFITFDDNIFQCILPSS